MHVARQKGWKAKLLDYRNSGDTSGDRSGVVGYAAIAFYEPGDAEADAPPVAVVHPPFCGLPSGLFSNRFYHRFRAFIFEMAKAKLDRIDTRGVGQLVHERFDGKYIRIGT